MIFNISETLSINMVNTLLNGAPDPPCDTDRDQGVSQQEVYSIDVGATANISDESDSEDPYAGYRQLAQIADHHNNHPSTDDESDSESSVDDDANAELVLPVPDCELESALTNDAEIEQNIWSAPRPTELDIEMDSSKTEQILAAMSAVRLPPSAVPPWARGLPEAAWKESLLRTIRQRSGQND